MIGATPVPEPGLVRCGVYTRKSSEEGLEQSFNSLHAQREACEAYVLSQKHEGWQLVPTAYDDGGFSGGSMERPGLKALLTDLEAGLIDIIVVYKVDRLTRSLADFAKMVERLDARGASFVSVTQAFNTTTSMGRLTLNVLLSFAQFEREVTGERIRDKIAASKAKGMWMGGAVPLGYDVAERTLIVNEAEAEQVRWLFERYRICQAVDEVVAQAAQAGMTAKLRVNRAGQASGGGKLTRGSLYRILANPLYVGEIPHKQLRHPGQHPGIVPAEVFAAVQAILDANRRKKRGAVTAAVPAPLAGLVWSHDGERLTSTHTSASKRYRYYASTSLRIPASDLEDLVVSALGERLGSPVGLAKLLPRLDLLTCDIQAAAARRAVELATASGQSLRQLMLDLIESVMVGPQSVTLDVKLSAVGTQGVAELVLPASLAKAKARLSLVVPGQTSSHPDPALIAIVAQARSWVEELTSGRLATIAQIAAAHGVTPPYVSKFIGAAFLAPDLVCNIVEGTQPRGISVASLAKLLPLPPAWTAQRALFAAMASSNGRVGHSAHDHPQHLAARHAG